jgi:hypothetical protein
MKARGELTYLGIDFAVQNCAERNVRTLSLKAGISTPTALNNVTDRNSNEIEGVAVESERVFVHPGHFTLLPYEWAPVSFRLN